MPSKNQCQSIQLNCFSTINDTSQIFLLDGYSYIVMHPLNIVFETAMRVRGSLSKWCKKSVDDYKNKQII